MKLKIDRSIKYRKLPDRYKTHLNVMYFVKHSIFAFTFILLDIISLIFIVLAPHPPTFWITIPLVVIINVWSLTILLRNTENMILEPILYTACLGVVGSLCNFVVVQKFYYLIFKFSSPLFFLLFLLIFSLFVAQQIWYQVKKFSNIHSNFGEEKLNPKRDYFIMILFAIGYIIYAYFTKIYPILTIAYPLTIFSFFCLFFAYLSVKFFHKYFFMKTNMKYVPLPKQLRKQIKAKKVTM